MITRDLQAIWWDWLGTSERLLRSLHEQTAAVMLRDVQRVERLQPEIERQLTSLQTIDERAVENARGLAEKLGSDHNFRSLVKALPDDEASTVHALANRVKAAAQTVQGVLEKNKTLIENELTFVTGSLHLIAKVSEEQEGKFGTKTHAAVLIDQRA